MTFPGTPITARYPGFCSACETRWEEGDKIKGQVDEPGQSGYWVHAVCPDSDLPKVLYPVCTACWLTHPIGACDR